MPAGRHRRERTRGASRAGINFAQRGTEAALGGRGLQRKRAKKNRNDSSIYCRSCADAAPARNKKNHRTYVGALAAAFASVGKRPNGDKAVARHARTDAAKALLDHQGRRAGLTEAGG